jgi:hypothetical protein
MSRQDEMVTEVVTALVELAVRAGELVEAAASLA